MGAPSNFEFLRARDERLARLGALAERYFFNDAPGALIKLRLLAEFTAKEVAAAHGVLPAGSPSFDEVLNTLKLRSALPREIADLFYYLKRVGNAAAHENAGSTGQALEALKIARAATIWFHQTYRGAKGFKPGPFVPPAPPADTTAALNKELNELRATVRASADKEAKALLAFQEAEAKRLEAIAEASALRRERESLERLAAEAEAGLKAAEAALRVANAAAQSAPPQQLDLLAKFATKQAEAIELDEAATRVLIDDQLRAAGWKVDTGLFRYAAGTRPKPGENIAIAEWPTASGPVDYALFVDGKCVGVVEAKRSIRDVSGRLGQAKRYARDIELSPDQLPAGAPFVQGLDAFRAPFVFVTNGRPFVKQLATKSGIWFWDARPAAGDPRAIPDWFSPRDLIERLEQVTEQASELAERELGVTGLRPYQQEAIAAVEAAVGRGQRNILLAMATGTGKTRLAIALMYELLKRKRFRRILFLVDRNALGRQTLDAMSTTDTSGFLKFDQVFPVADLARKFPEATDRVQVATVQAMIRRVFEAGDEERPTPGTYDLIIVDEAHRGYTLDAELREDDLGFRNLEDYLSAYRRVLDYFDAAKVALTATPALHTREIFGPPVFRYGYRQAVIDGWLIDHRPPRRITTALSQTGIVFGKGEKVNVVDLRTWQVDLFDLPDQVDFEVAEFNKKVYTRAFNRAVAEAIAQECPPSERGKTLLFAARDDHADILVEELRAALTELHGPQPHDLVEKITGSVDKPLDRIKAYKNDPRPKYVAKAAGGAEFGAVVMATCIAPVATAAPVAAATVAAAPAAAPAAAQLPPKDSWYAPPAKVADNFYFLGTKNHAAWALVATNGDMIIIDNLFAYAAPDEIIGGLKRLGLDPNKAKYNIVSHAHGDHDGGVPYIQQNIPGITIVYGVGDWPAVDARTGAQKVRHDPEGDGTDGRVITVGDVSVRLVSMPGHTPGTTSMLFDVKDGGVVKHVAYNGGTLFSFTEKAPFYDQYIAGSDKFGKAAAAYGATWLITNHNQYDSSYWKSHTAANRKPGDPSPFDLGASRVADYFVALQSCAKAAKLRATGEL